MHLLLLGKEVRDLREVRNFSGVYSFFLTRALREAGVAVTFSDPLPYPRAYRNLNVAGIDHIIGIHSRHFDRIDPECLRALRQIFRGTVAQLSDRQLMPKRGQQVDCTFTARETNGLSNNHYIGWAADPEICRPGQLPGELMVLIDHPDYVAGRSWDRTEEIRRQVRSLVTDRSLWARYETIAVYEIADGGIVPTNLAGNARPFLRRHIPFVDACAAYGRASLYLVTHRESLGLTVLETAMCGALPVVPRGFVRPDRLKTVRHVLYDAVIDWPRVIKAIDVEASRSMAMACSWAAVAERILAWYGERTNG